uniref:Aphid transmission protein n=1 Tax=Cauliflower mosaic virus TaxID=10641 RepID=Q9WI33_9VIRU|nr:aphid transmission helper factor [Cauliflower mosaic virus]AAU20338.1 aphid transmission protein [Cauliflower mosaic virus]AAZ95255.1 aphid transmission protein [Cauliflower mosaic virus]AAZ95264.1 aphid transmission protein [Cauliflower mosaic virus]ABY66556.1 aphid transmission protein [Cauliflower mosaic virus]
MSITGQPHVYKKDTIIRLKPLSLNSNNRSYVFSSSKGNIQNIINHLNNLNEIVGRSLLGIWKINSYFGLSKDPSESKSKNPSVFNTAKTIFKSGGVDYSSQLKEIKSLLEAQNTRIKNLEKAIQSLDNKIEPEPLTKEEVKELKESINSIKEGLKNIIG